MKWKRWDWPTQINVGTMKLWCLGPPKREMTTPWHHEPRSNSHDVWRYSATARCAARPEQKLGVLLDLNIVKGEQNWTEQNGGTDGVWFHYRRRDNSKAAAAGRDANPSDSRRWSGRKTTSDEGRERMTSPSSRSMGGGGDGEGVIDTDEYADHLCRGGRLMAGRKEVRTALTDERWWEEHAGRWIFDYMSLGKRRR